MVFKDKHKDGLFSSSDSENLCDLTESPYSPSARQESLHKSASPSTTSSSQRISIPVSLLLVAFAWSSWIDLNGLWVELPLLVGPGGLPERWTLPSYIAVITQLANIGPLLFALTLWLTQRHANRAAERLSVHAADAASATVPSHNGNYARPDKLSSRRTESSGRPRVGSLSMATSITSPLPVSSTLPPRVEVPTNVAIISVGAVACVLLAFFWDKTAFVAGDDRSVAFLGLTFSLALVDCTSSLSYLGFMASYPIAYLTPFYIGEGLSGLLPSIVAFGQGAGEYTCIDTTNSTVPIPGNYSTSENDKYSLTSGGNQRNGSIQEPGMADKSSTGESGWGSSGGLVPQASPEEFSVRIFMLFLFSMMLLSLLAFLSLEFIPYFKKHQIPSSKPAAKISSNTSQANSSDQNRGVNPNDRSSNTPLVSDSSSSSSEEAPESDAPKLTLERFIVTMVMAAIINALGNGILPSIQSFSLLPYGPLYYSVGIKLAAAANPIACTVAFVLSTRKVGLLMVQCTVVIGMASWIIAFSAMSPTPPLAASDPQAGGIIMIFAWIVVTALISHMKVSLAKLAREEGRKWLVVYGAVSQGGSLLGALLIFILSELFQLFTQPPQC